VGAGLVAAVLTLAALFLPGMREVEGAAPARGAPRVEALNER
jgi:hypothetical protein